MQLISLHTFDVAHIEKQVRCHSIYSDSQYLSWQMQNMTGQTQNTEADPLHIPALWQMLPLSSE